MFIENAMIIISGIIITIIINIAIIISIILSNRIEKNGNISIITESHNPFARKKIFAN